MALVYNSFKNESCKNLKRSIDDDEDIYQSRYKRIKENLEKRGLVEVNQDVLSEQFNKLCKFNENEMDTEENQKIYKEEYEESEYEEYEESEYEESEYEEYEESEYEELSEEFIEEIDEEKYNMIKEIESLIQ